MRVEFKSNLLKCSVIYGFAPILDIRKDGDVKNESDWINKLLH